MTDKLAHPLMQNIATIPADHNYPIKVIIMSWPDGEVKYSVCRWCQKDGQEYALHGLIITIDEAQALCEALKDITA